MPANVLYGDSFLVSEQLKQLSEEAGADSLLEANRHQFQGGQFNLPELLSVCNALPFMDSCRLIVVSVCWPRWKAGAVVVAAREPG